MASETPRVVTVFGGSGFIGRALVQRLARLGCAVRCAGRDPENAHALKPMGDVGQITAWPADVRRPETLRAALQGADACVNLVGILYERGARTFEAVHIEGAANTAQAARQAGCAKFIHMSALGADAQSKSKYAQTKAQGEAAVKTAFPDAVIFRPSVVFGAGDSFFNMFAGMTLISPMLPVIGAPLWPLGGGGPKMQPVHVGDVAEVMARALCKGAHAGETYSLGGPSVYTFRELMALVLRFTGRERMLAPMPFFAARAFAAAAQFLPKPLLTPDQVKLLQTDNVTPPGAPGFEAFGVSPRAVEAVLPAYLRRFAAHGRENAVA